MLTGLRLAGSQLRRGWRSLVAVTLLIGLAGGLTLAAAAGSRRTFSAVDRMIDHTDAMHVLVNPVLSGTNDTALDFEAVKALPMVVDGSRADAVWLLPPDPIESFEEADAAPVAMAGDGGVLYRFNRMVLTAGRVPDPDAVDEWLLENSYAEQAGLEIGDEVTWRVPGGEDVLEIFTAGSEEEAIAIINRPDFGQEMTLRVTGIGTTVEGVAIDEGFEPVETFVTPAFYEAVGRPEAVFWGAVFLLDSVESTADFRAAVDSMVPDERITYQTLSENEARAERSTGPAAVALMVFTVVVATIGLVLVVQAFARQFQREVEMVEILSVLGTTRGERFIAAMVRASAATAVGVALAIGLAWLVSPLFPVGPARPIEPRPGFDFDAAVLLRGSAIAVVVILLGVAAPARRWSRRGARRRVGRRSSVAGWLSSVGASVPMTLGVRFGLEPSHTSNSVPTRATIVGSATAVSIVVAMVVFAQSLDRVVSEPRFYGSNYDAQVDLEIQSHGLLLQDAERVTTALSEHPAVIASGPMRIEELPVGGQTLPTLAFSPEPGAIGPTILAGRAPAEIDEIALGGTTMERLRVGLGDEIPIGSPTYTGPAEIVGQAVLPGVGLYPGSDRTALGTGAVVHPDALEPATESSFGTIVVDVASGSDREAFDAWATSRLGELGFRGVSIRSVAQPADIESLARLRNLPVVLAGVLVVLVAATVVHAMVLAVRSRRRDLAVIQGLGATSSQVRMIGVWHGLSVGAVSLVVGVPIGLIVGRWFWIVLAEAFGTLAEPVVAAGGVLALSVMVIASTGLLGLLPSHLGLRRRPGEALRRE